MDDKAPPPMPDGTIIVKEEIEEASLVPETPSSALRTEVRGMKRKLGVAQETVRVKSERLKEAEQGRDEAEELYQEEHRSFAVSKRDEEKWEQRFNALAAMARAAGVRSEEIEAVRKQPFYAPVTKWKATLARRMRLGECPSMAELGMIPKAVTAWHVAKGRGRVLLAATPTFLKHLQTDKAGCITAPKHINHLMRLVAADDQEQDLAPRLARIGNSGPRVAWYSLSAANKETLKRIASGIADVDSAIAVSQFAARTDRLTARVLQQAGKHHPRRAR